MNANDDKIRNCTMNLILYNHSFITKTSLFAVKNWSRTFPLLILDVENLLMLDLGDCLWLQVDVADIDNMSWNSSWSRCGFHLLLSQVWLGVTSLPQCSILLLSCDQGPIDNPDGSICIPDVEYYFLLGYYVLLSDIDIYL